MLYSQTYKSIVLSGKSVGILSSLLLEQATTSWPDWLKQRHTLGHDDCTPTSKITTVVVIINCMLFRKSTNTKTECIYLIVISIAVLHV
jgi:hypothetical protein